MSYEAFQLLWLLEMKICFVGSLVERTKPKRKIKRKEIHTHTPSEEQT